MSGSHPPASLAIGGADSMVRRSTALAVALLLTSLAAEIRVRMASPRVLDGGHAVHHLAAGRDVDRDCAVIFGRILCVD